MKPSLFLYCVLLETMSFESQEMFDFIYKMALLFWWSSFKKTGPVFFYREGIIKKPTSGLP